MTNNEIVDHIEKSIYAMFDIMENTGLNNPSKFNDNRYVNSTNCFDVISHLSAMMAGAIGASEFTVGVKFVEFTIGKFILKLEYRLNPRVVKKTSDGSSFCIVGSNVNQVVMRAIWMYEELSTSFKDTESKLKCTNVNQNEEVDGS